MASGKTEFGYTYVRMILRNRAEDERPARLVDRGLYGEVYRVLAATNRTQGLS
jgi:hypothetical protein